MTHLTKIPLIFLALIGSFAVALFFVPDSWIPMESADTIVQTENTSISKIETPKTQSPAVKIKLSYEETTQYKNLKEKY